MNYPALRKIQIRSRSLRDQLIESPYAWPGGYPLFAVASDGGAICKDCCKTESRSIGSTYCNDGWSLETLAVNWEDPALYCNHCSTRIESAYAEEKTA